MNPRDVILRPVVTEKSMENMAEGKYTFEVDPRANKFQIKRAVEEIFDVEVERVNTMNVRGKLRRMGRTQGRTSDRKKAIVTLKAGQKIQAFEEML